MDQYVWFFIYFFIETYSSLFHKINKLFCKKPTTENRIEENNIIETTKENKIQKYLQNHDFATQLNKLLEKKQKQINKKKIIPINSEELLENFCIKKNELALKNIKDWNFEKHLTYEINDPYLFVIENSFSNKECDEIINQFEKNPQYQKKVYQD